MQVNSRVKFIFSLNKLSFGEHARTQLPLSGALVPREWMSCVDAREVSRPIVEQFVVVDLSHEGGLLVLASFYTFKTAICNMTGL